MEIKERILNKATEMCFKYGIRSVTMDDIAKELGISKKTIYQNFEDKDEIIFQIMQTEMEKDKCEWADLGKISKNLLDKMTNALKLMRKTMVGMNSAIIFDIKRYHPRAWALFQNHKNHIIKDNVTRDLNEGIKEGMFRDDINVEFMATYRIQQVEMGFNPEIFPTNKFDLVEIQTTLMDHFIRGILTEKGLKQYNSYQKSLQS
jgi:TetR/AcrR family transcriptional regulator, cholesterol catabolism regulator